MEQHIEKAIYQDCLCSSNLESIMICYTQGCLQTSFMCINQTCRCKKNIHDKCKTLKTIDLIQNIEKNHVSTIKENNELKNAFNETIYYLADMNYQISQLKEQFDLIGLGKDTEQLVKLLNYMRQDRVDGNLTYNIMVEIQEKEPIFSIDESVIEKILEQKKKRLFEVQRILTYQQLIRENFLKKLIKNVIGWSSKISVEEWKSRGKKLEDIQELDLWNCDFKEIPPQLKFFSKLKKLRLTGNKINVIKNLDNLTELEDLIIQNNQIKELNNLEKLTQLKTLSLDQNQIKEIANLDKLTQLLYLMLPRNQIKEIVNLEKLTQLKTLFLYGNPLNKNEQNKKKIQQMKKKGINVMCEYF